MHINQLTFSPNMSSTVEKRLVRSRMTKHNTINDGISLVVAWY
jgi:hypothetical protein